MEPFLYIIAGIILLPFLLNPIVLKIKLRDYYEPALEEMSEQVLPREVKNYFDSKANELEQLEFKHCADAVLKNYAGTAEIYTSLWFNRQKGIQCSTTIAYMRPVNKPTRVFAKSISMVTRFSETMQWESSTSPVPTPLATLPSRPCINLPQIETVKQLFAVHQILAARFNLSNERLLPAEGQEFAMLRRKIAEINQYQVQVGRWILDTKPNIYRLAWKGALINGWQFAWPVKDIRKRLLIKNAQKIIASLPK